jgi:hypothetical protein
LTRLLRRLHQDESGVSLLLLAAGMAAFLGIAAIVIDIGLAMSLGRTDQNAADFAALAAANDAYLGITLMQTAAQDMTDENFGESVPLTGCSTELNQPGSPFAPITDCLSVAPFGDLNSESIRRVGQTWVGVPDQTSGPAFGPSIDTRRAAAAAIIPRAEGRMAPLMVDTAGPSLACLDVLNPDVNAGCLSPLSIVNSPRCSGGGLLQNLTLGIDHLIAQSDGTLRLDDCVTPGSNVLADWPGNPVNEIEAMIDGGFLSGTGQLGLDPGIDGACAGNIGAAAIADCIGGALDPAALSEHFYYFPVVDGGNSISQFGGLYIAGIRWQTGPGVPGTGLPGVEVIVTYDTALHGPNDFQCRVLPGSGVFNNPFIGPWNDNCIGPGGLGDEIYNRIIDPPPPDPLAISKPVWDARWLAYLRFDNRADFLQMTAYVIPAGSLPQELIGIGSDVNPYEVDGLIQ